VSRASSVANLKTFPGNLAYRSLGFASVFPKIGREGLIAVSAYAKGRLCGFRGLFRQRRFYAARFRRTANGSKSPISLGACTLTA
jgi:hypothetical protein